MYRQQSRVVTLILRFATVFIYSKYLLYLLDCFPPPCLTDHFESPETEVLSRFVWHLRVAEVGLCGEISFDVFAFIVCGNLLCRVYALPFNSFVCASVDLYWVCWWDHVFFCLLPIITKYLTSVFSVTQVVLFLVAQILVKWELTVIILLFSQVWSVLQTVSH